MTAPDHSPERDHRAHVATILAAQPDPLRERVLALADEWEAYDCVVDPVPDGVDVPDDFELGVNMAGRRLRALVGGES